MEKLSLKAFRRRIVAGSFSSYRSLSEAFRTMRFVQADPIRAPARAQDLILRQRVKDYRAGELEKKYPSLRIEEGFLFAYGFMTPDVWIRTCRVSKPRLTKLDRDVLQQVQSLGEVHPRLLEDQFGRKSVRNAWGGSSRQTKHVLEKLHQHGILRVRRRDNGIRVYQLPTGPYKPAESHEKSYRDLTLCTAHAFGPTTRSFLLSELRGQRHMLPNRKRRQEITESLVESGELQEVRVGGVTYLWDRLSWQSDECPERVRILAPFDPLVRDRERFQQLWDWIYRFEAYTPPAKRERGYYAMPVLWRDTVIGWCNAEVTGNRLKTYFGYVKNRPRSRSYARLLKGEVNALARFLGLGDGSWELFHDPDDG